MKHLCCATWKTHTREVDIYEFNEKMRSWSRLIVIQLENGVAGCVYAAYKLFIVGAAAGRDKYTVK